MTSRTSIAAVTLVAGLIAMLAGAIWWFVADGDVTPTGATVLFWTGLVVTVVSWWFERPRGSRAAFESQLDDYVEGRTDELPPR